MIMRCPVDPDDPTSVDHLMDVVADDGLAVFDGVADRAGVLRLARRVLAVHRHRDSEPDGITVIHDRGDLARQPGYAGFSRNQLSLHTESSALEQPPGLMMLSCARAATAAGDCHLADGASLARELAHRDPELLALLCTPRSVLFGGATGHLGSVLTVAGPRMSIRLRLDALARYSPLLARRLPDLRRILADIMITVRLRPGTGYLLSNTRWLHGRAPFTGDRIMYRLLGDPHDGAAIAAGFPGPVQVGSAAR
jgi:alpha-ketoglutarate-dependent taurine dioxygenase